MTEHIAELPEKLRIGQTKAIDASIDRFHDQDRNILWMCCGSGKTVACAIVIELRGEPLTLVLTPYIHLVKQWGRDYLKWLPTTQAKFMYVCSEKDSFKDGDFLQEAKLLTAATDIDADEFAELVEDAKASKGKIQISTNPDEIADFLKQSGRKVVFCTYASSPTYGVAQRLAGVTTNFGIFDEAQWTATGDIDNIATHALHDENVQIDQRLFTTATVRHYTRDGLAYSMDNEEIYGGHVLVDDNGDPDPWTMRQAIDAREAPPYRIVLSFVVDPKFNAGLVQLPPYRELIEDLSGKADPSEVMRLIGLAMALERTKAKYGVKKPLGFSSRVSTARLFSEILNRCKKYPEYFPLLSQTEPAVSISAYDSKSVKVERIAHLHNSHETEINNARLFLFGADEPTIDATLFIDPMTSDGNVIQAAGRAQRLVRENPDKVSTIIVPVMLPYFGDNLAEHAERVNSDQIKDAFRKMIDILDSLADMDPILRRQMNSGVGKSRAVTEIIEFDFPEEFLPEVRDAIEVAIWRAINPETDFMDRLQQDASNLNQYRHQAHPEESDPIKEAKAAELRRNIRIIPKGYGFDESADRMARIRSNLRAYYNAGKKDGRYGSFVINAQRAKFILDIYNWDERFVMHDEFLENLRAGLNELDQYRLKEHPENSNLEPEAIALSRSQIRRVPLGQGYASAKYIIDVKYSISRFIKSGRKAKKHGRFYMDADREQQVYSVLGWDENYILQDELGDDLRRDIEALNQFRLIVHPEGKTPEEEVAAASAREKIKIIPQGRGFQEASLRMGRIRLALKAYYSANKKNGTYHGFTLNAKRAALILSVYNWSKDFVVEDVFEENLKQAAAALDEYKFKLHPKNAELRAKIRIIRRGQGYDDVAEHLGKIRASLKEYFENDEQGGSYRGFTINKTRVDLVFNRLGWDKDFVMQDDYIESLKNDRMLLDNYRMEVYPEANDPQEKAIAASNRSQIRTLPHARGPYLISAVKLGSLRRSIKAWYDAGKTDGTYSKRRIDAKRVQQIYQILGWDEAYILRDDFEEYLKRDALALASYKLKLHPRGKTAEEEAEAGIAREKIMRIPMRAGYDETSNRMAALRRDLKAYYEAGRAEGSYGDYILNTQREHLILESYGWTKEFISSYSGGRGVRGGRRGSRRSYHNLPERNGMALSSFVRSDHFNL